MLECTLYITVWCYLAHEWLCGFGRRHWYLDLFTFIQADVYDKCVEPLVKSCMEGYNATVFAYGQTVSVFNTCKITHFSLSQDIVLTTVCLSVMLYFMWTCLWVPEALFLLRLSLTLGLAIVINFWFWFYDTQLTNGLIECGYHKLSKFDSVSLFTRICLSLHLRQIIDLFVTDKSWQIILLKLF